MRSVSFAVLCVSVTPWVLLLGLACGGPLRAQEPTPAVRRPNILFVFTDDHAAHAISAYGSQINRTPNLDRIAHDGVLFRNNFCGNALCGPSRATILTGAHSHGNGFMRNGNVFDGTQTTFAQLLHDAGYQTAILGKWHLGSDPQGFDTWRILPGQGQYYNPDFLSPDGQQRIEGHVTDLTTDLALDWLERRDADRPFVLMCQYKAPHRNWMPAIADLGLYRDGDIAEPATLFDDYQGRGPAAVTEMTVANHLWLHYDLLVAPTAEEQKKLTGEDRAWPVLRKRMTEAQRQAWDAAFAEEDAAFRAHPPTGKELVRWQYQRYIKNYLRCVAGVDRNVGRLLDWLDAHPDVKRDTVVVYSSDQGFFLGDHGWYDKRWIYEQSLRMPLLVAWPEHFPAGREVQALTQNIDFAPTFLDLAGVAVPATMQGKSLVPLLRGETPADWREAIYYHYYESQATHNVAAHYGLRTSRYKLAYFYEPQWQRWELYDLASDPDELDNLAGKPDAAPLLAKLQQQLRELRASYGDSTGELGVFPVTAGIASVIGEAGRLRIWANTSGGYALLTGHRPGRTTLATSLRPVAGRQSRNGGVVVSGGDPQKAQARAAIDFDRGELVVTTPGGDMSRQRIDVGDNRPLALRVVVDLGQHTLTAEAAGARVSVALPATWTELTAWGYGGDNAETSFAELVVE